MRFAVVDLFRKDMTNKFNQLVDNNAIASDTKPYG